MKSMNEVPEKSNSHEQALSHDLVKDVLLHLFETLNENSNSDMQNSDIRFLSIPRITSLAEGRAPSPPLSSSELTIAHTIEHCLRYGLVEDVAEMEAIIAEIKKELLDKQIIDSTDSRLSWLG